MESTVYLSIITHTYTDIEGKQCSTNTHIPCAVLSPAPCFGHVGQRPQQTDLDQKRPALNNAHVDWGTWRHADREGGT